MLKRLLKPLVGSGIGNNKVVSALYKKMSTSIVPDDRIVELPDFKIKVHDEIDGISQQIIFNKVYEPETSQVFRYFIKKGMYVMDIGANIGYYTLLSSSLLRNTGMVVAFEPELSNFNLLSENVWMNKCLNVICVNSAVGGLDGVTNLNVSNTESGEHSICSVRLPDEIRSVRITKVDSFGLTKVDFIKIDVEGAEVSVLQGMSETCKDNKNIIMVIECWPKGLSRAGTSVKEFWSLLDGLGFKAIYVIGKEVVKINMADIYNMHKLWWGNDGQSVNLLCFKSS